jgi:hypothetical protein
VIGLATRIMFFDYKVMCEAYMVKLEHMVIVKSFDMAWGGALSNRYSNGFFFFN